MDESERVEHYQHLRAEAKKAGRWFTASSFALIACLILAATGGAAEGWPWLAGALGALGMALWALIDSRHYQQLIALHLLPNDIRTGR